MRISPPRRPNTWEAHAWVEDVQRILALQRFPFVRGCRQHSATFVLTISNVFSSHPVMAGLRQPRSLQSHATVPWIRCDCNL
jgi:hypothetical protein